MIGVVDYEAGNISSVANALSAIGVKFTVSSDKDKLNQCSGIILPGVGAAPGAMASLRKRGLTDFLTSFELPFLGICLGMQLLYQSSEEGETNCLGILQGSVKKFDGSLTKVPHMGWNDVEFISRNELMKGPLKSDYFYCANSYYAEVDSATIGTATEGVCFAAAVVKDNFFGVQFHPEKSAKSGLMLLKNFDDICKSFQR